MTVANCDFFAETTLLSSLSNHYGSAFLATPVCREILRAQRDFRDSRIPQSNRYSSTPPLSTENVVHSVAAAFWVDLSIGIKDHAGAAASVTRCRVGGGIPLHQVFYGFLRSTHIVPRFQSVYLRHLQTSAGLYVSNGAIAAHADNIAAIGLKATKTGVTFSPSKPISNDFITTLALASRKELSVEANTMKNSCSVGNSTTRLTE